MRVVRTTSSGSLCSSCQMLPTGFSFSVGTPEDGAWKDHKSCLPKPRSTSLSMEGAREPAPFPFLFCCLLGRQGSRFTMASLFVTPRLSCDNGRSLIERGRVKRVKGGPLLFSSWRLLGEEGAQ